MESIIHQGLVFNSYEELEKAERLLLQAGIKTECQTLLSAGFQFEVEYQCSVMELDLTEQEVNRVVEKLDNDEYLSEQINIAVIEHIEDTQK
ncbi:MAG: hypothetical protein IJ085_00165 [Turicibacter sp.]|nr:hypothetical protein [Turicibacter sp.]